MTIIFFKDRLDQKNQQHLPNRNKQDNNRKKSKQQTNQRSEATSTLENVLTNILDQRIQTFLNDPNVQQLQFEDGLSPFGRRYVHELAEKHNLQHISEGVGDQRHITIIKRTPIETNKKQEMVKNDKEEEEINGQFRSFSVLEEEEEKDSTPMIDKKTKSSKKISDQNLISTEMNEEKIESPPVIDPTNLCRYCHKDIPPQNLQLHEIYCQRVNPLPSVSISTNGTSGATSSKLNVAPERSKTVKKKENKLASIDAEAPIDDLLEAARQQDNICNAQRCKAKITLLGQLCSYCNRRYCFEHSMPEVHGCGHQARKDIRQTHISTHTNVKPVYENSSISKDKRPYLERKLQDKIASKESQRKKK